MYFARLVVLGLCVIVLGGCTTMTKKECELANWHTLGYEDGLEGEPNSAFTQRRKDCAEHGLTAHLSAYKRGYQQALPKYCTAKNATDVGKAGKAYHGVCPAKYEQAFLARYKIGKGYYDRVEAVRRVERALVDNRHRIEKTREDAREASYAALANPPAEENSTAYGEWAMARMDLKHLYFDRRELKEELDEKRFDLKRYEERYPYL